MMLEAAKPVGLAFLLIYLFGTIPMVIRVAIDRIDGVYTVELDEDDDIRLKFDGGETLLFEDLNEEEE